VKTQRAKKKIENRRKSSHSWEKKIESRDSKRTSVKI